MGPTLPMPASTLGEVTSTALEDVVIVVVDAVCCCFDADGGRPRGRFASAEPFGADEESKSVSKGASPVAPFFDGEVVEEWAEIGEEEVACKVSLLAVSLSLDFLLGPPCVLGVESELEVFPKGEDGYCEGEPDSDEMELTEVPVVLADWVGVDGSESSRFLFLDDSGDVCWVLGSETELEETN